MGFRSWPFLLFLPPLPLAALLAAVATCLALLMAAFFMSFPFMIQGRGCRRSGGEEVQVASDDGYRNSYRMGTRDGRDLGSVERCGRTNVTEQAA